MHMLTLKKGVSNTMKAHAGVSTGSTRLSSVKLLYQAITLLFLLCVHNALILVTHLATENQCYDSKQEEAEKEVDN